MKKPHILVVYYSYSGTTQNIARQIAKSLDADIKRIRPLYAYPDNRPELLKVSKEEINSCRFPALQPLEKDLKKYDVIIVGSPNWYSTIAPPLATFLRINDFNNKLIAPFITHGGGEFGHCIEDIYHHLPSGQLLEGMAVYREKVNLSSSKIEKWLIKIGLKENIWEER